MGPVGLLSECCCWSWWWWWRQWWRRRWCWHYYTVLKASPPQWQPNTRWHFLSFQVNVCFLNSNRAIGKHTPPFITAYTTPALPRQTGKQNQCFSRANKGPDIDQQQQHQRQQLEQKHNKGKHGKPNQIDLEAEKQADRRTILQHRFKLISRKLTID